MVGLLIPGSVAHAQPPKPLGADYLHNDAQTQGYGLGRRGDPTATPNGKTILFLAPSRATPMQALFAFDVETQKAGNFCIPINSLKAPP